MVDARLPLHSKNINKKLENWKNTYKKLEYVLEKLEKLSMCIQNTSDHMLLYVVMHAYIHTRIHACIAHTHTHANA